MGTPISGDWSEDNIGWVMQDVPHLYNWYAVAGIFNEVSLNDPSLRKQLAPTGWRVATDSDWANFKEYLMSNSYNCDTTTEDKLSKAISSTQGWEDSIHACTPGKNPLTNNLSGFNALPKRSISPTGGYGNNGYGFIYWSSTEQSSSKAWYYYVNHTGKYFARDNFFDKNGGFSVRFVRDASTASVEKHAKAITVYPNPTSSTIEVQQEFSVAKVYSITGQELLKSNSKTIDLSELPSSVYLLRLYDNSNKVLGTTKVVKQ
ncbi:MAG: T9SS type A sorting domain-containing protein [Flavobacteriaceae bacterium]|nr:T9SS type A sorting domain-containing protein [Flavobacteriaceae bacterium]